LRVTPPDAGAYRRQGGQDFKRNGRRLFSTVARCELTAPRIVFSAGGDVDLTLNGYCEILTATLSECRPATITCICVVSIALIFLAKISTGILKM
jgi:hypothetical protein